ncbi:MAG: phosphoketolase, partial [Mesorhizobium sp.]
PWTIHRLTYRRTNHDNIHVRGYNEEGTTTTPFDMTVLNGLDRYHLVLGVLDRLAEPTGAHIGLRQAMEGKLLEHHAYIRTHGQDMPEIIEWKWEQ